MANPTAAAGRATPELRGDHVVPGVLGLLLPAVFGPVALIAGFVSQYQALRAARRLLWVAVLGIVLGTFWTPGALVMLSR